MSAPPQAAGEAVTVPLPVVERELTRQLKTLQAPDQPPVPRVRMSNLIIFCQSRETAGAVAAQLPEIAAVHPARVLLLVAEAGPQEAPVTATVHVQRHRLEPHVQVCSERVTLHAAGGGVDRLPFAVRALMIGDLPTNLWWATSLPPPLAGELLYELAEQAQQIVYDSIGWPEPARGVAAVASWLEQIERPQVGGRWRVAADLNWRRLKYWRRLLTQSLDPASAPGAIESVTDVLVEHGPHAVVQAWELVSWLAQRLDWRVQGGLVRPGVEIAWGFAAPHGEVRVRIQRLEEGPPELRRVRLACRLGDKAGALDVVVQEPNRLAVWLEGMDAEPRTVTVPPLRPAELIGRQLSDRERDPVFRESMAVAQVLAQSVLA